MFTNKICGKIRNRKLTGDKFIEFNISYIIHYVCDTYVLHYKVCGIIHIVYYLLFAYVSFK